MTHYMGPEEVRIVKTPLPIVLIRRMDETVVAGRAGFQTRTELIQEAIENLLNELDFAEAPSGLKETPALLEPSQPLPTDRSIVDLLVKDLAAWERDELTLEDLTSTRLARPQSTPHLIRRGEVDVRDESMLGLHNRDYPSLWALSRLARYTIEGPIAFDEFVRLSTRAAWYFGAQLSAFEASSQGQKVAALFPTNMTKRPSAERGFETFAIGSLQRGSGASSLSGSGPLFAWRAIQVLATSDMAAGVTQEGLLLLQDLEGISLELPHSLVHAERFLDYLGRYCPADLWGFQFVTHCTKEHPNRGQLVAMFNAARPQWTPATASSVAQGYVARAREWGLVEQRLVDNRYGLTEFGQRFSDKVSTQHIETHPQEGSR